MYKSLLPIILASLGSTLISWAIGMPLFEWQVSEIITNLPSDIRFNASPWIAKFGDSLEDDSVIFHQFDGSYCGNSFSPEQLNSVVKRSRSEKTLEQITRKINRNIVPWLWLLIVLSGIYVWWFALHHKRPISEVLILSAVAIVLLCILLDVSRPFFAIVVGPGCLEGTVMFNANLSKVHYETLIVFFTGILLELGAVGIILQAIKRDVIEARKAPR
jgi:hypothetical protein